MVIQVTNPIIEEQLTIFRDTKSSINEVYRAVDLISLYLVGEASKLLTVRHKDVKTPLGIAPGLEISENIELVPIARAGLAMLPSFERLLPCSHIGVLGATRHKDLTIEVLYDKISNDLEGKTVIILDTMLATGSTISKVISLLKNKRYTKIIVVCILATQVGIKNIQKISDIPIIAVGINETLDRNNYVFPGVGDSGDRLFGQN